MKRNNSRRARGNSFLRTPCCLLSAAMVVFSLAETALRWDAMAPPFRVVFRLIGTGKLTAGEIFDAVRPEIVSGALVYPLCVLLGALCGLWGLGTILLRRRGFTAAAMYLCAAVLTALCGGGTALRTVHILRCVLTAGAGCLYAVHALLPPGDNRERHPDEEMSGEDKRPAGRRDGVKGEGGADRPGRLFDTGRRPLFKDREEHVPLFDRGTDRKRR